MQALGQVAQSQGALAQSQMSPFQQALQANMQVAQAIPQFGAQQFGILSSFGDQQQQYAQAGLDAISQANKLAQYAPYEQMGFVGNQLAALMGGWRSDIYWNNSTWTNRYAISTGCRAGW